MPAGAYPLHGWLHCRWAGARAVQRLTLPTLLPYCARTPLLSLLYRLLGARIGRGALLDTAQLQVWGTVAGMRLFLP